MRGHDLPFLLIDTNNTAMIFHERDLLFCGKFISPASNEAAFKREMNIRGDDFFTRRNLRSSNHANFLFIFIRLGKGVEG